jgi:hypothetical protein
MLLAGLVAACQGLPCATVRPAVAENASPFAKLAGRWVGEGRFGIRNGNTEAVKCRVTYILVDNGPDKLRQTIRCSAPSDTIEVQSLVTHVAGRLNGTWRENMTIILAGETKQVVEIQFIDSNLIGLTLVLQKG